MDRSMGRGSSTDKIPSYIPHRDFTPSADPPNIPLTASPTYEENPRISVAISNPESLSRSDDVNLKFKLPPVVRDLQNSVLSGLRSATTLSALFSIISMLFLFIPTPSQALSPPGTAGQAYQTFAFLSVLSNISSSVTSFLLADELSDLALISSRRKMYLPENGWMAGDTDVLGYYGLKKWWMGVMRYWFICLLIGITTLLTEIFLYMWLLALPTTVKIVVSVLGGLTLVPLVVWFPLRFLRR